MKNNISLIRSSACTACAACFAVCPAGAISTEMDAAGFLRAKADDEKCIECGMCNVVCPLGKCENGADLFGIPPLALQSCDGAVLKNSASGGIAHELAEKELICGGKVVGAVYDPTDDRVCHRIITDASDIRLLDGSKYLQSDTGAAFKAVVERAKEEHFAVFGTPCQISGLHAAAKKLGVRKNLLLVEIFCHGVPSYRLWEEQLEKMRAKTGAVKFKSLTFRDKSMGWHNYRLTVSDGQRKYCGDRETTLFWQVYFEDVLLNDACYSCTARLSNSLADIRIGDYWGALHQSRTDGVSLVFPITESGQSAIDALIQSGKVLRLESTDAAEALRYQNMKPYPESDLHKNAMRDLAVGKPVGTVIKEYRKRQPLAKKLKRTVLVFSAMIPQGLRQRLKRMRNK